MKKILIGLVTIFLAACGGGGSSSDGGGPGNTDGAFNGTFTGVQNVTLSVGGASDSTGNLSIRFTVDGSKITLSAGSAGGEGAISANNKFTIPVKFSVNIPSLGGVCNYAFNYNGTFESAAKIGGGITGDVTCPNAPEIKASGPFTASRGAAKELSGSLEEAAKRAVQNLMR